MRKIMLTTLAVMALVAVAGAEVLWDQSDYDVSAPGFFNTESGSPPFGMTMFTMSDIVVDDVWHVTSITTHWSILDVGGWELISQAYVNIFPKTGPLPEATDDPTLGTVVTIVGAVDPGTGIGTVTATVDLNIEPGEYWIGVTPIAPAGPFGVEVMLSSATHMGDDSPSYDAYGFPEPMWMNFTPGQDATILVEGDVTVATEEHSLTNVKALFR